MLLSSFRRDAKAMRDGEWVSPGLELEDFEVKTRAILPSYSDKMAALTAREARKAGGEAKILFEVRNRLVVECLIECCLLDVRNLWHDAAKTKPVTFDEFCDLLRQDDYAELAMAVFAATQQVGRAREEDLQAAAKNSGKPSATI